MFVLANYISNVFSDYNPLFEVFRIPWIPIELSLWCLPIYKNATKCVYVRKPYYILINYFITTNSIIDIHLATFWFAVSFILTDWKTILPIVINVFILFLVAYKISYDKSWKLWNVTYCNNLNRIIFCISGNHDKRPFKTKIILSLYEVHIFDCSDKP